MVKWNKSVTIQGKVPEISWEKHHSDDTGGSMGATGIVTLYRDELTDEEILALENYISNPKPPFKFQCLNPALVKKAYLEWWTKAVDDAMFKELTKP